MHVVVVATDALELAVVREVGVGDNTDLQCCFGRNIAEHSRREGGTSIPIPQQQMEAFRRPQSRSKIFGREIAGPPYL